MANTGGTNGSVKSVTESGSVSIVTIHYPDAPDPPGRNETYDPAPGFLVRRADAAKPPLDKIDVMVDDAGQPTSAKNHG